MIKIFSVTVNDSGQYAVRAMFKSPHPNDKEQKYITVLKHLHIEGKEPTIVAKACQGTVKYQLQS